MKKLHSGFFISFFAVLGVVGTILSHAAPGTVYYVANGGNDANSGSQAAPFATIAKALSVSTGGETIYVQPGIYQAVKAAGKPYSTMVSVVGQGASKPLVQGDPLTNHAVEMTNVNNLSFSNLHFEGRFYMRSNTSNVKITGNEINLTRFVQGAADNNRPDACIDLFYSTGNITIADNYIHNCEQGLSTAGGQASGLNIIGNTIDWTYDGVMFGDWDNVLIDHNTITNTTNPSTPWHKDHIQFLGQSTHVVITNNVLAHTEHQSILIQPASGPISDVLVQNNLITDVGATAVHSQGVAGARFINNVIWNVVGDGLLLRPFATCNGPTDTVLANNVFKTLTKIKDGCAAYPSAAYEDYNLIGSLTNIPGVDVYGPHDIKPANSKVKVDPKFANASAISPNLLQPLPIGDFHPASNSPLIDAGVSNFSANGTTYAASNTDLAGQGRLDVANIANLGAGSAPYYDIGAYEYGTSVSPNPPPAPVPVNSSAPVTQTSAGSSSNAGKTAPKSAGSQSSSNDKASNAEQGSNSLSDLTANLPGPIASVAKPVASLIDKVPGVKSTVKGLSQHPAAFYSTASVFTAFWIGAVIAFWHHRMHRPLPEMYSHGIVIGSSQPVKPGFKPMDWMRRLFK